MKYDAIIIGAGAAGVIAAITAAKRGRNVLLIDGNGRIGKKLRITGKGRCNVTNMCDIDELMRNIPVNSRFLYSAFSKFPPQAVMEFFVDAGVPLKVERGNRVFPVSDSAPDVVDALEKQIQKYKIKLLKEKAVKLIIDNSVCRGVITNKGNYESESVLVATGGASYPVTGSTGDGYGFAEYAGHTVTDIVPSLVPLEISEIYCRQLTGLSLRNVTLTLFDKNKPIFSELGELMFTCFGVTGPLVLTASSRIRTMESGRYRMEIDLKPGLPDEKLDIRIQRDFREKSNEQFANSLNKLLPLQMIPVVTELSSIAPETKVNQITKKQRTDLVKLLKHFPLTISDFRPVAEAIVTSGGVQVKEIDPKTMQSKLVSGLYFAGEVLDADGYTGGFNLQIAFSTGYAAGTNI